MNTIEERISALKLELCGSFKALKLNTKSYLLSGKLKRDRTPPPRASSVPSVYSVFKFLLKQYEYATASNPTTSP